MIGTRLAERYEILAELGRGGMGVVYRARDPRLQRDVAIKLVPRPRLTPALTDRLRREAQVIARMDHPRIVTVFDMGEHDGGLFFVMPVVAGQSLSHEIKLGKLSLRDVITIGVQLAEALDYSHRAGVLHRDVKPGNVMVTRDARGQVDAKIMDFGLALTEKEGRLTRTGDLVGTLSYVSPEQVMGQRPTAESDIYALGCVLYACLAGRPPFRGEVGAMLHSIQHETPRGLREQGLDIPAPLDRLILDCLAKRPNDRPRSAEDVGARLRNIEKALEGDHALDAAVSQTASIPRAVDQASLVGRTQEFAILQQRLERAAQGSCQLVAVTGGFGVGKTRLLQEFTTMARGRDIRVLFGRIVEADRGFPYQGFSDLITEYFLHKESGSSTSGPPDFSDLAADLIALFPTLSEVDALSKSLGGTPPARRVEEPAVVFELLARTLARISAERPLVLVIEDLHRADVSVEALGYVFRRLTPTPTLIVTTLTPTGLDRRHPAMELLHRLRGDPNFEHVHLRNLAPSDHALLVKQLLGGGQLTSELSAQIHEVTEGNPLFTRELVQSLVASEALSRHDTDTWTLSPDRSLSSLDLPLTVQQAVERRLETLPEHLLQVLGLASILGRTFEFRELEMLAEGEMEVEDAVDQLEERGLLIPLPGSRDERMGFASGVVCDVAYGTLPRRRRRRLHERQGELLEQRYANRVERVAPRLMHHFASAGTADKAILYGLVAARHCLDAFSPHDALQALGTILRFLEAMDPPDSAEESEAHLLSARAHRMTGALHAAYQSAQQAYEIARHQSDPRITALAALQAARLAWEIRRTQDAADWVEVGLRQTDAAWTPSVERELLILGATLANLRGDYGDGESYSRRAAALVTSPPDGDHPDGGTLVVALGHELEGHEPALIVMNDEREMLANVFETLMTTDGRGYLEPKLAESLNSENGGSSFLVRLRQGVRFHDGTNLDARAVKTSMERAHGLAEGGAATPFRVLKGIRRTTAVPPNGGFQDIPAIEIVGPHALRFHLAEPTPIFPVLLSHPSTAVARIVPNLRQGPRQSHGTGPFRFEQVTRRRTRLVRWESYWGNALPHVEAILFHCGVSSATVADRLLAGEIHLARDLTRKDRERVQATPGFRHGSVECPKKNTYFVLFNLSGRMGTETPLRRALAGSIPRHDLVWRALGPHAIPATGIIPPGILGHDAGRRMRRITVEEARQLTQFEDRDPICLRAAVGPMFLGPLRPLLDGLLKSWRDLGVEVEIVTHDLLAFLATYENNENLDLLLGRWNADYDDPDDFTHGLFHSLTGVFRRWYGTEDLDALMEEARRTEDQPRRIHLYREIEARIDRDAALIPLFHDMDYRVAAPTVRGLRLYPVQPYVNYAELSLGAAPTPRAGATGDRSTSHLHIPSVWGLDTLDPAHQKTRLGAEVIPCIYETLYRVIEGSQVGPWLAEDALPDAGGSVWRIRLRRNVSFHDGRRLSARDVRWSFERLLREDGPQTRMLAGIAGADDVMGGRESELRGFRVLSAHEFEIHLESPIILFPLLLTHPTTSIVPEGFEAGDVPPGTGPFRVTHFDGQVRVDLEVFRQYWRPGVPANGGLTFHFNQAPEDIYREFRAGRFSLASHLLPADRDRLRLDPELGQGYRQAPALSTVCLQLNCLTGPLSDAETRRSLAGVIDRDGLVAAAAAFGGVPATGLIPPDLLGPTSAPWTAGAGEGTREGFLRGLELTVAILPSRGPAFRRVLDALRQQLRSHGVVLTTVSETMEDFVELVERGATDLLLGRFGAEYPDADSYAHGLYRSRTGIVHHYFSSAEVDTLIEEGRRIRDPEARRARYASLERILLRDHAVIPLIWEQNDRFARPEIDGLDLRILPPVVPYERLRRR